MPEAKPVREQILDAALACFHRYGVAKTTVDDIADAAGVSRATVYRYVEGGRDELVLSVLLTEAQRQISPIVDKAMKRPTFAEQLAEIGGESVLVIRKDEGLAMLFSPESIGIGSSYPDAVSLIISGGLDIFGPVLARARDRGEVRDGLTDRQVVEWLVRNAVSLLTFGSEAGRTRASVRRYFEDFVIPPLVAPSARP